MEIARKMAYRMNVIAGWVCAIAVVGLAAPLLGQSDPPPPPMERVLVPVFPENLSGAFGSVWNSELIITNAADRSVIVARGNPRCTFFCEGDYHTIAPRSAFWIPGGVDDQDASGSIGQMWYVEKAHAESVRFNLRLWDVSRGSSHWGVSIPVVREETLLSVPVELAGAPASHDFRVSLRVYELQPTNLAAVRVIVSGWSPGDPEEERERFSMILPLRGGTDPSIEPDWPIWPAMGAIHDLVAMFPEIAGSERMRVRIEPLDDDLRYWGFLSITHNETQNVTVIAPE
jgi:hypothetical protein